MTRVFAPVRSMNRNRTGITWMEDGRGNHESKKQNINLMSSTLQAEGSYSFGKAKDRFNNPTEKLKSPAPNVYDINGSMGVERFKNSPFQSSGGRTIFGRETKKNSIE